MEPSKQKFPTHLSTPYFPNQAHYYLLLHITNAQIGLHVAARKVNHIIFPNKTISFEFCHFLRRKWNEHILTKIMNFFVNYTQKYVRRLPTSRLHSQSFTNLCLLISTTFIWQTKRYISQSWLFVTASSFSFITEWTENLALLAHLIFSSSLFWHAKTLRSWELQIGLEQLFHVTQTWFFFFQPAPIKSLFSLTCFFFHHHS